MCLVHVSIYSLPPNRRDEETSGMAINDMEHAFLIRDTRDCQCQILDPDST